MGLESLAPPVTDAPRAGERPRVALLRGLEVAVGDRVLSVAPGTRRVLAFLAVQRRPVTRSFVCGTLWPDVPERRAQASLRSALWRIQRSGGGLVSSTGTHLRLGPRVTVDLEDALDVADGLLAAPPRLPVSSGTACSLLGADLLPDWYDDWLLLERERFRQLRLHALEALSSHQVGAKRFEEAVRAALLAVEGEPLRESAHRALVQAYLAEGNVWEAVRQYRFYRHLVTREIGIEPSALMEGLVRRFLDAGRP